MKWAKKAIDATRCANSQSVFVDESGAAAATTAASDAKHQTSHRLGGVKVVVSILLITLLVITHM
jgi:hypothetical protein